MGWISDVLKFDNYATKDFLGQLGDDPSRLLTGIDPASTALWNGILGTDKEPLVDQLGGPYGGSAFSAFGANNGGVYGRAQEDGINTGAGKQAHDIAHVVAGTTFAGAAGSPGSAGNAGYGGSGIVQGEGGMVAGQTATEKAVAQAAAAQTNPYMQAAQGAMGAAASPQAQGGMLGSSMPVSQSVSPGEEPESNNPLDMSQSRLKGFGRKPIKFRGQVIWV